MLRKFVCRDGTVFASAADDCEMVTVDEVIAFLEQHRGKKFWNGAAGETSFKADDTLVSCDTLDGWTLDMDDEDYGTYISEWFYYEEDEWGDDSEYTEGYYDNTDDDDDDDDDCES